MPIYEYRCAKCEYRFEALQSVGADGRDLKCPECGERAPERMLSTFASATGAPARGGHSCGAGFG